MSASKLGGLARENGPEKNKPAESKEAARALVAIEKELAKEQLRAKQSDSSSVHTLPSPAERRKILERASLLISEARSLLERLDGEKLKAPVSQLSQASSKPSEKRSS